MINNVKKLLNESMPTPYMKLSLSLTLTEVLSLAKTRATGFLTSKPKI